MGFLVIETNNFSDLASELLSGRVDGDLTNKLSSLSLHLQG